MKKLLLPLSLLFIGLPALAMPMVMPVPSPIHSVVINPIATFQVNSLNNYRNFRSFWVARGIVR